MKRTTAIFAMVAGLQSAAYAQREEGKAVSVIAKPEGAAAPERVMPQVEIKGGQDYDPRRDDTASKTVIRQEDMLRYGDTNVYDVLKRAPGVTVIGQSIRMRGLGNGYTQVLVNGERPPPGFDLESVAPEQIDKIEIIRAATAEYSTRAIAGTINIVMKKVVSKAQRDLRLNGNHSGEGHGGGIYGTLADRDGSLSYYLNGALNHSDANKPGTNAQQFSAPDGTVQQLREGAMQNHSSQTILSLLPRLTWKLVNNDQFSWGFQLTAQRFGGGSATSYVNRIGAFAQPDYQYRSNGTTAHSVHVGSNVNWVGQLAGGKLDISASVTRSSGVQGGRQLSSTADRQTNLRRDTDNEHHNNIFSSKGKYTRSLLEGHAMAAGWDVGRLASLSELVRTEGFVGGAAPAVFRERFEPVVAQLAAFAQDEWNVTKLWSIYLGARWEGIRTDSAVSGKPDTRSFSHVLSPIAQTLYKFPDKSGRQLRLALTRTYKAPTVNQLTARRYEADLNTRFSPDHSGNPDLRPELATGVDLTYEHFWAPAAVFSVGASERHITDYMRTTLSQGSDGRWLYQPVNDGGAQVRSLDLDVKFPAKTVWPDAPALDLRGSVNRNWSQVASVPGPDNRLDEQIPLTAVLGVDYKADPWTMGASFAFRSGGPVRISEQQSTRLQVRRDLDAYLLYRINPRLQLRVAANNVLPKDNQTLSRYVDSNGISENWGRSGYTRRWQANLEIKL